MHWKTRSCYCHNNADCHTCLRNLPQHTLDDRSCTIHHHTAVSAIDTPVGRFSLQTATAMMLSLCLLPVWHTQHIHDREIVLHCSIDERRIMHWRSRSCYCRIIAVCFTCLDTVNYKVMHRPPPHWRSITVEKTICSPCRKPRPA